MGEKHSQDRGEMPPRLVDGFLLNSPIKRCPFAAGLGQLGRCLHSWAMSWVPMDDGLPKLLWERKTYKKLKEIIYNFLFFIIAVKDPTLKFVRAPMVPTIWLPWLPCIRKIPAII